jgi:hypothetical protein
VEALLPSLYGNWVKLSCLLLQKAATAQLLWVAVLVPCCAANFVFYQHDVNVMTTRGDGPLCRKQGKLWLSLFLAV